MNETDMGVAEDVTTLRFFMFPTVFLLERESSQTWHTSAFEIVLTAEM